MDSVEQAIAAMANRKMEHPYPQHIQDARTIAADGIVLLKNKNGVLPLQEKKWRCTVQAHRDNRLWNRFRLCNGTTYGQRAGRTGECGNHDHFHKVVRTVRESQQTGKRGG